MRVLVTGASGFSGSHIALHLSSLGHNVWALTRSGRGRLPAHISSHLKILQGDLSAGLQPPAPLDAVVHAAASSPAPGTCPDLRRDNVVATREALRLAKAGGAARFIFLSSLSVHGRIEASMVDERTPLVDPDEYGRTKRSGEEMLAADGAISSVAIRLPGVIGPGSVRNWLTQVLEHARAGRPFTVYNPDAPYNNAAHIDDLCRFIALLLAHEWRGFDAFPIGAAGQTTAMAAARQIVDAFGGRATISTAHAPKPAFTISSERARSYGYTPMEITAMIARFAEENRGP